MCIQNFIEGSINIYFKYIHVYTFIGALVKASSHNHVSIVSIIEEKLHKALHTVRIDEGIGREFCMGLLVSACLTNAGFLAAPFLDCLQVC